MILQPTCEPEQNTWIRIGITDSRRSPTRWARQDFRAAEKFIERTLSSLLGWSEDEPWRPGRVLLPESRYYCSSEAAQAKLGLLDQWEDIAARLGKPERVAHLRLQRTVLQSPENWSTVLEAFEECKHHLSKPTSAERLFAEWQQRIAAACMSLEFTSQGATDTRIHRLIEAQRNLSSGQEPFLEHVDVWLECCREHAAFFQMNWRSLEVEKAQVVAAEGSDLGGIEPPFHFRQSAQGRNVAEISW